MAERQYPGTRKKGVTWGYRFKVTLPNGKKKEVEKSGFKSSYEAYKAREMAVALYKINHYIRDKLCCMSKRQFFVHIVQSTIC